MLVCFFLHLKWKIPTILIPIQSYSSSSYHHKNPSTGSMRPWQPFVLPPTMLDMARRARGAQGGSNQQTMATGGVTWVSMAAVHLEQEQRYCCQVHYKGGHPPKNITKLRKSSVPPPTSIVPLKWKSYYLKILSGWIRVAKIVYPKFWSERGWMGPNMLAPHL